MRGLLPHALSILIALSAATACGSAPSGGAKDGSSDGAPDGGAETPSADDTAGKGDGSGAEPAATGTPAGGPAAEPEATKEANALVIELTITGKGDLDDKGKRALESEAMTRIRKSAKLALPSSKGVTAPRNVLATLTVEAATDDKKKGLTVKLGMTGVVKDGRCPLFDLDQKMSMSDGKKDKPDDVAELRRAALGALFDELEQKAPTMKPSANCTPGS
jgi:hypothetical protein